VPLLAFIKGRAQKKKTEIPHVRRGTRKEEILETRKKGERKTLADVGISLGKNRGIAINEMRGSKGGKERRF